MLQAGSAVQKVWIRHGDRAWDLQVVLEVDQASLRFLAFAMEQPVLRLTWDGNAEQRWSSQDVPEDFDPELILEDLILIRAHATQLQRELPSGWQLLDRTDRRELLHRGRVRTRIQMRGETYLIEHPQWGMHVEVVERVLEAVP
ncbi:MAG: hypothetical protein KatS3mg126_0628 [Lysobacteraceae bacterium]|nr:MAG: hypothetical protein KatS3mg126_0628 [Xanthomonadaceae bacterium]